MCCEQILIFYSVHVGRNRIELASLLTNLRYKYTRSKDRTMGISVLWRSQFWNFTRTICLPFLIIAKQRNLAQWNQIYTCVMSHCLRPCSFIDIMKAHVIIFMQNVITLLQIQNHTPNPPSPPPPSPKHHPPPTKWIKVHADSFIWTQFTSCISHLLCVNV